METRGGGDGHPGHCLRDHHGGLVEVDRAQCLVLLPPHNLCQVLVRACYDGRYPGVSQAGSLGRPLDKDGTITLALALLLNLNMSTRELPDSINIGSSTTDYTADSVGRNTHFLALANNLFPASIWHNSLPSSSSSCLLIVSSGRSLGRLNFGLGNTFRLSQASVTSLS